MGKKNRNYDEKELFAKCKICDEEITIEHYMDRGDLITCEECDSEYIIKSRNPVLLTLVEVDDD